MNEDKASRYHRLRRRAAVLTLVWTMAVLSALALSGAAVWLGGLAGAVAGRAGSSAWLARLVAVSVFVTVVSCLVGLGTLPIAVYQSFVLERRYGLSTQPFWRWLLDEVKMSAAAWLVAIVSALIVLMSLELAGWAWWIVAGVAFALLSIGLAAIAPILLLPLFAHSRPLDREPLRTRLLELAARAGRPAMNAFVWEVSQRTKKANAALTGLGATRRILVSDTLLADYSDDEIEMVLAHELAHHLHRDIWRGLALEGLVTLGALFVASRVLPRWQASAGVARAWDVAVLPVIAICVAAVGLLALPVANALSRSHERRADQAALALTGKPAAFVSAMRRLGAQNLAEQRPSRLVRWLFYSHPPLDDRIRMAESQAERNTETATVGISAS